ncbi:MAG: hypothetical protein WC225_01795 [Acholeplasmataceae bacterium]
MKKSLILVFLFTISLCLLSRQSHAQPTVSKGGINLLNLSTLYKTGAQDHRYIIDVLQAIEVEPGQTYTLVSSETFLQDLYETIDQVIVSLYFGEVASDTKAYQKDMINKRAYLEFEALADVVILDNLIIPETEPLVNYEIILYQGTYADFPGFEPYIPKDEVRTYIGDLFLDYDFLLPASEIKTLVQAIDPDGNPIDTTILYDDYTESEKQPGAYQMVFSALHNRIQKTFSLHILINDHTPPVIVVPETIRIPLVEKLSIDEIKTMIEVYDNVDTLYSKNLTVLHDSYTTASKLGPCEIQVEIKDTAGNKTQETVHIELIDEIGPTITGTSQIYLYTTDGPLSNSDILVYFTIKDDVALNSNSVKIIDDAYRQTVNPGVYSILISAQDMAGNLTTKEVFIHVIDNRGPIFQVDTDLIYTTMSSTVVSEVEIVQWFEEQLLLQGIQTSNIKVQHNEYELKNKQPGQYYVYLTYQAEGETVQTRILMDVQKENRPIWHYLIVIPPVIGIAGYLLWRKIKKK